MLCSFRWSFFTLFPPLSLFFSPLFGVCATLRKQVSGKVGQCEGEERDERRGIQRVRVGEEKEGGGADTSFSLQSLKGSKQKAAL